LEDREMLVWISGERNEKEEKRLGEAIAGAFTRGIALHGETMRKEFKIRADTDKARLVLIYRLAILSKVLTKQDCLVVVAHTEGPDIIEAIRKITGNSLLVLINQNPTKGTQPPFMVWNKKDTIYDRDEMVDAILRKRGVRWHQQRRLSLEGQPSIGWLGRICQMRGQGKCLNSCLSIRLLSTEMQGM
jgi:hypothetical protein